MCVMFRFKMGNNLSKHHGAAVLPRRQNLRRLRGVSETALNTIRRRRQWLALHTLWSFVWRRQQQRHLWPERLEKTKYLNWLGHRGE